MRVARALLIVFALLVSSGPALALSGTVLGQSQRPLEGAKICYMLGGAEGLCVSADKRGHFTLPDSQIDRIRITFDGYMPLMLASVTQPGAIVLEQAAAIWVRLVDDQGQVLDAGEVFLIFPSGVRKGPFPTNDKGVRVRSLSGGQYRIVARSEGWVQDRSFSVTLTPGTETKVDVGLIPLVAAEPANPQGN